MKTPFRIEYSTDCWPSPDAEDIANRTILGIVDADGTPVARNHDLFEFDAEACRRIVASVNALAAFPVEIIEGMVLGTYDNNDGTKGVIAAHAELLNERQALRVALEAAKRLIDEALPKFNWRASALDANAIHLLNTVPGIVRAALGRE